MSVEIDKDNLIGYECKHVLYAKGPNVNGKKNDVCFVKLRAHLKDGTTQPLTRLIYNYERPFWITKEGFRKHKEPKEYEELDKVKEYRSNQAGLVDAIKRAIRVPGRRLKEVCDSPYVYGADVTSPVLIKQKYKETYPDLVSDNSLAVLDIETDVVHGTHTINGNGEPILISLTMKNKAIICATSLYTRDVPNFKERLEKYHAKRIKDIPEIDKRNVDLEVVECITPLEAIEKVMQRAHEWQPDFITVWNINFDIPIILKTIEMYGGDVNEIFSDPSVPRPFRNVWYQEGPAQKISDSGVVNNLHWADRWHTLHCLASFYFIDQAAVFRAVRISKGKEAGYGLDYILNKYTNVSKLKNDKADGYTGLDWHVYMQKEQKLEYAVYCFVDCVTCEILDEQPKVQDISRAISSTTGSSEYIRYKSQPRRTVDKLHFFCLEHNKVIGTTGTDPVTKFDKATVTIDEWIITLPAHLMVNSGLTNIKELPGHRTRLFVGVYDSDVSSAYPFGEAVLNCGRSTTVAEIVAVKDIPEKVKRDAGLNLSAGTANAIETLVTICGAPTLEQIVAEYDKSKAS